MVKAKKRQIGPHDFLVLAALAAAKARGGQADHFQYSVSLYRMLEGEAADCQAGGAPTPAAIRKSLERLEKKRLLDVDSRQSASRAESFWPERQHGKRVWYAISSAGLEAFRHQEKEMACFVRLLDRTIQRCAS